MKIIGLDFGTTNSTISYYDAESQSLDGFRFAASDNQYIPTIVAYNKNKNNEISIGDDAKWDLTSKDFEVYEHFKLRLGKNFDEVIEGKTKTPIQVTHDFIKQLLEAYKKSQNIDEIEGIVMTVPETWFREASNRTARENIEKMFKELGYGELKFQLESEPVAAAAYFCRAYERDIKTNPEKKKYNGFIIVIDYGGGTLDVTLCEVLNGDTIRILERCGFGEYNKTNGCAGVAFDEAVVEKLVRNRNLPIQKGTLNFIELRNKFEDGKIKKCDKITKGLKYYYDNPAIMKGETLFSFKDNEDGDTIDVRCEDLDECFKEINAPKLKESLEQIMRFFPAHNVDSSKQENFRVLLVGGFSNFLAVEKTVREFFGSTTEDIDKRFEQPFPVKNRALAISRGAALIAEKVILPVHTCIHSYGYIVSEHIYDGSDRWIDKYVTVIEKGTNIKELNKPVFNEATVQVWTESAHLKIFEDDGRPDHAGRRPIALDESVKDIFPNLDDRNNEYRIGFSVNKNQIPTIHIKDKHGNEKPTSLNKLFERIGITQK
jgi:molecular chaperone DnaK